MDDFIWFFIYVEVKIMSKRVGIILTPEERQLSDDLDKQILRERTMAGVDMTTYIHDRVDKDEYVKARNKRYKEKYYQQDPEKFRAKGRENYAKHREQRLQHNHEYYQENREEILDQKAGYYLTNREEILKKRKEAYIPHPKEVIDTPEAEAKRQRERERYQRNKAEINRKRREKRRKAKNGEKCI